MMEEKRWGGWDMNIFDNPEKCGFTLLEVTSMPDPYYKFHYVILLEKNDTKEKYWAEDSGCSCPSPFEEVHGIGDLTPLRGSEAEYNEQKRKCALGG